MAAHSGGVDWASVAKPLSNTNSSSLDKTEILNLVKAIIKGEREILEHDEVFDIFFMSFTSLAANTISGKCSSICQSQMPQVIEASGIIIRYILTKLETASNAEIKLLLPALKCLCDGRNQDAKDFDQIVLTSILRNAKCPEHLKTTVSGGNSVSEKDNKSEMKRSRSDLSSVILQQLITPLSALGTCTWTPLSEDLADCSELFIKSNIALMEERKAGDVILKVCSSLPSLAKHYLRYEESTVHGKTLFLPILNADASIIKNSLPQMSADMSVLSMALSLPVLDPLSPYKINQLSQCAMSALYCAVLTSISVSVLNMSSTSIQKSLASATQQTTTENSSTSAATTASDESSDDDPARIIVDKALEIFNKVGDILKKTRSHIYQNHVCMGAWLLISGIQGAMGASGSNTNRIQTASTVAIEDAATTANATKGKSPSRTTAEQTPTQSSAGRVNLFKVQQGFGVLNAAIASHSLTLLTELIEDLKIESRSDDDLVQGDKVPEPAGFDILGQFSSLQRIVRVLNTATMQQLLTFLATVSYRKACTLKRINIKNDGDPISFSDSTTYFNDTISCSEDSESEDEEDSYLGVWFKETISPELKEVAPEPAPQEKSNQNQRGGTIVSVKDEPHEYLELSAQIFTFLDTALGSNHKFLHKYVKSGLSEQQMILLANILKDLDRDAARGEPDNVSGAQWQSAMVKFAGSLGRYLHNLISGGLISESLQSSLLLHLGVSPWTQDTSIWPLQVYSRTLSVLVQILLLKPSQEKEAACLSVWHRLVNTLVDGVCSNQLDPDYEDLNVEHAQLLLFLFHSLNLMQKKSVLLLTAGGVIRCAEVCRSVTPEKPLRDHQIMLLSRLLLFLEYLMKHLYNAPTVLLEQVRWNLFSIITLDQPPSKSTTATNDSISTASKTKMQSFCRKDLEDKHRKHSTDYGNGVRPKFYSLTVLDTKIQQEFKLDGLAWNFILCTPDKLKYPLLIDALIDVLAVTDIAMAKVPFQTMCAVNYCFTLCWKLLLGLPPSTPHVEALMQDKIPNLHLLIWAVRCLQPVASSNYLIVNSLVKQGMYTQYAESLWNKITEHVSDMNYSVKETILGLDSFNKTFQIYNPRLSKIITFDALISHLHVVYWIDKECVKPKSNNNSASAASIAAATAAAAATLTASSSSSSLGYVSAEYAGATSSSEITALANILSDGLANAAIDDAITPTSCSTNDEITKELLLKLLDTLEIVLDCTFKTMTSSLNGPIPEGLMESLISINGSKHPYCPEIVEQFTSLISGQDKDTILNEWRKQFQILSEDNFSISPFPVEWHTLSVIDAHLSEIFKYPNFSVLLSLKHALKSIVNVIFYILPVCKGDVATEERLKMLLVPMLCDLRTEYLYDIVHKCLETLIGQDATTDTYQMLVFSNILKNSYKLLIDYAEMSSQGRSVGLDETVLHNILKCWEQMLDKSIGLKVMFDFFYVQKKGSLVQVLLSFANTSLSQLYSTKVLQFFEKLFQSSEKANSPFNLGELSYCVLELCLVDHLKLKNWLSHILLGPMSTNVVSSAGSSNVQTPTNMATVSAIPSISDQMLQPSELTLDPNAMDIDYDCMAAVGAAGPASSSVWHAGTSITTNRSESGESPNDEHLEKNGRLLQTLTKYIVSDSRIAPDVSAALFQALIQLGQNLLCLAQDSIDFTDLLQVMVTLADASHGEGHSALFTASIDWLEISKTNVLEKIGERYVNKAAVCAFENITSLLRYMVDLLQGLGHNGSRALCPPWEEDSPPEFDEYNADDLAAEDEDSAVEDSDEDSLGSKLCTYSVTQKEFMNQHWYHCHTCKMVDGVGVCSVCARVCHKNHDLSYAKFGNFFCDCGAKEDASCQALNKRSNLQNHDHSNGPASSASANNATSSGSAAAVRRTMTNPIVTNLLAQRSSSSSHSESNNVMERALYMAKMIDGSKDSLKNAEQWKTVVRCILYFFENLMPTIKENCAKYSTVGCHLRAKNALDRLHQPDKSFRFSDPIMVATLGSQEGAFENVRANYIGDQAQTIRQLIATNMVRRVGLCCLSSPHGKRQHLAISHEKGKVTILQLSALLKQADAAKKKLTISRLASAPIPCTIMSLASNPANEDFLAVCGLKECHILTFSSSGAPNEHIVITPQLETGNFIKRALWLPGSQTMLAIITCDYVKIYELSEDTYSPQYYFVVPSGKIRDCTFVYQSGTYYLLLFASSGYIYTQPLVDESLAKHGAFYVTNTLEIDHPLIVESKGALGEGAASIYYSHLLQMLFFSYSIGRNFMAPLTDVNEGVKCVMLLQTGPHSKNVKTTAQSLMQWTEVAGHPGLIFAMMNQSNNPVVFMLKPDGILMQEIKYSSAKSKIMDMVAIRHTTSGQERTTLLLLCEDGSLRTFAANPEYTNFWLSPEVQPISNQLYQSYQPKSMRKSKKTTKSGQVNAPSSKVNPFGSTFSFPVDFFEHCTHLSEVEFGGNDLLQIYNTQQLKHRLHVTGLYVASSRSTGFTLEITNNDPNVVMTGLRIMIGTQDITRAPPNVTILGRVISTMASRSRWFDIPLTREESLQSDKKLSVLFGPTQNPDGICMLDSVKVYGKTKDVFGWPEETEEIQAANSSGSTSGGTGQVSNGSIIATNGASLTTFTASDSQIQQITSLDKMLTAMLEVLDSGLGLLGGSIVEGPLKQKAMDIATIMLLFPLPTVVQSQAKCVLATLHGNRQAYNNYKDKEILSEVNTELDKLNSIRDIKNIDPEAFFRLVVLSRSIAVARPHALSKICQENQFNIVPTFMKLLKDLFEITPNYELQCSIVKIGLSHTEATIHCLVEIIYAFALADTTQIEQMTKFFVQLLLDKSLVISHSAKQAMIRLLRPRIKRRKVILTSSPPGSTTPTPSTSQSVLKQLKKMQSASGNTDAARGGQSSSAGASSSLLSLMAEDYAISDAVGGGPSTSSSRSTLGNVLSLPSVDDLLDPSAAGAVGGDFPQFMDFPHLAEFQHSTDDEAVMEIAIALSIQENEGRRQALQHLNQRYANLLRLRERTLQMEGLLDIGGNRGASGSSRAGGNNYDTTTSAAGSDDEGSNAATEGSTLRTSPAGEHAGSVGSESGGSVVESIGETSGRSSTYGDALNQSSPPRNEPPTKLSIQDVQEEPVEDLVDTENTNKLHALRTTILQEMVKHIKTLETIDGQQAIPFMQVILMLTANLDGQQETDQSVMQKLLQALIERLEIPTATTPITPVGTGSAGQQTIMSASTTTQMVTRTAKSEVQLVILRLLGVLMGKIKSSSKSSANISGLAFQQYRDNSTFVAAATANALLDSGAIPYCLSILKSFLPYWNNVANNDDLATQGSASVGTGTAVPIITNSAGTPTNIVLKLHNYGPEPDLQPFFGGPTVAGKTADTFEHYPMNITDIAVRLPYQILKLSSGNPLSMDCFANLYELMTHYLCEYMMVVQSTALRRIIRKLLLFICGSKDKYRQSRDMHSLDTHIRMITKYNEATAAAQLSGSAQLNPVLGYDAMVELTEHLRACQDVAAIRTGNWQRFCLQHIDVLPSLLRISTNQLAEGVAPIILQLLQAAICNSAEKQSNDAGKSTAVAVKSRSDRDKSEDIDSFPDSKFDPSQCSILVSTIFSQFPPQMLTKFIKIFLLETNTTSIRWQAHALIYAFYENSTLAQRERLLNSMWDLWPLLPAYGRRTAQFVDLLGYLTLTTKQISHKWPEYMELAVNVLRRQNERLAKHPNALIYTALGQLLHIDGFYLESEPCLVCNNPEIPMSNIKLSSVKIDSKFTTTTTIVKLSQSHTISKIILRIAELKRTKMVRTINIFYNNRTVQAVVELKNRPSMWHKARKVTLQSGQTDVKIEFSLPITACNLMIEYADFYETVTGSSENLQCPRCSAAVPANPGVCGNCGENVFQCHKCRAINYDEKDPFLCHSCGFCKYAKFDYNIFGRACCAVDPIESADDRAKTVQTIHASQEKADRVYRNLQESKNFLEFLVAKLAEQKTDDDSVGATGVSTSELNKNIQLLVRKYCTDSKTSFEELGKIIQKVQACRRELVAYDRSQMDLPSTPIDNGGNNSAVDNNFVVHNRCYGCALASTEQCLTLLRAMASNVDCRVDLCKQGLVEELAQNNLRRGTSQIQDEVRQLLCLLTRDLPEATQELCKLILGRVQYALSGIVPLANVDAAVRHEMNLLDAMMASYDSCWEQKLKVVFEIFLMTCRDPRGPVDCVLQPSLKILEELICPPAAKSKANKDKKTQDLRTVKSVGGLTVDYRGWLKGEQIYSFDAWKSRMPKVGQQPASNDGDAMAAPNDDANSPFASSDSSSLSTSSVLPTTTTSGSADQKVPRMFSAVLEQKRQHYRNAYLMEKYGLKWRYLTLQKGVKHQPLQLTASWLHPILFNTNSNLGRKLATTLLPPLVSNNYERRREFLNLLTGFLKYIGDAGETAREFIYLYQCMAESSPWNQYLVLKGTLFLITDLLAIEIEKIHRLEETTLSSDLAQGYALRELVGLLSMFLDDPKIRQVYKGKLLGPVLQGYLSLRKLVVQRTRLVDEAQEKLLEMLEEMTTGTEEETRAFMSVLIDTVCKTPMNDIKTPVFIFERLCSIIHPEENDIGEFFLTLEKDAQQEDFLQGRMLGNPYPSSEAGLGPLMRDVKNKICMDCELVALLEDDNGMELLVYNKIISLDLPVKEVYKKVWLAEGGERDTMRIVYRMRGLLGDATEEFVESLNNKSAEEVDNEQLYRMANVLVDCGGLKVMLDRIAGLQNVSRSRSLLQVLLKLFLLAVKVRRCQEVLCQPELGAINTLLKVLQLCLQSENDSQQSAVTEQLLEIMETILSKAASDTLDSFLQFSLTFGGPEYVTALISCTNYSNVRNSQSVLRHLIRVLAALVYGNDLKMALLCEHFKATLNFSKFDAEHGTEDEFRMELFCVLTNQIEHNSIGGTLKDYIVGLGIVDQSLAYITSYAPCVKPTLLRTDSDELKEFISRPALKYILRFLTGLTTRHEATQLAIAKDIIPIIHRLEQVSSDEHVGSLAENLLEALCTDPVTAKRVQEVRDFTRAEKKRLAMATREKQLDALGMRTNDKGQVTAKGSILQKIEKLRDETGLTCFICREGYACQPAKVLGIYTFTKRTNLEEFELKPRKTVGYTTVTHFNVVHIDCHMSAIRLARGRDEWESASLQNANTRCNGLLPLWGPDVAESAFASCMTRHNANMQESTKRCDITFTSAIHDLRLLLQRFAQEKSFHEDAGGGGPQSNMHLVPYLLFYALYILLSSRSYTREEKTLTQFLTMATSADSWLSSAYEVEGAFYQICLSLTLHTPDIWKRNRLAHLKRLIATAHVRHVSPTAICKSLTDKEVKDYAVYKPALMMWSIVDNIYKYLFKTVTTPKEEDWPISLFDFIRRNDEAMLKSTEQILLEFNDEFLPCSSFQEFCDFADLLNEINDPDSFLKDLIESLPTTAATAPATPATTTASTA